jgi:hypothetical protein
MTLYHSQSRIKRMIWKRLFGMDIEHGHSNSYMQYYPSSESSITSGSKNLTLLLLRER